MVFESAVADVLNRFLGDYVENLNRNQLKIGIWGGDVVLENLILKANALDELDLPVQVVYGHLGKLVLKIPWKNLYGASVEASVESLYLIANPLSEIKYDAERDEKNTHDKKMSELKRVEEAKKKEAQKDSTKVDDTFVEKLATQIIKNVQLNIKDIHIRYEDTITNPKSPFACGITMHNLAVQTTDNNWIPTVVQQAVTKIYKVLSLEGLALYWNEATDILSRKDRADIIRIMKNEIATKTSKPKHYSYFLGPINATAKLILNPKPEVDSPKFSVPKVQLSLHMEQLLVGISKAQYQEIMKLADSMSRMAKAAPYRKYRPNVPTYRGYYKDWWRFAYKSILEEEIRRRRRNWQWDHMRSHRNACKEYAEAYRCQLTQKKVGNETLQAITECERKLDLFNLVIIRQRIELEVERLGKIAESEKKGWFSSLWGGSSTKQEDEKDADIITKFEKAMTPEEKQKLFRAIDYHENSAPLHIPREYEAIQCQFQLDSLALTVKEGDLSVLYASVNDVSLHFQQRPSASAIRVDMRMRDFYVTGVSQKDFTPKLASRRAISEADALLILSFETNPLGKTCDQSVRLRAEPLQLVYDAKTVNHVVSIFVIEDETNSALERIQLAAENQLSNLKEKSALGMQYAVEKHTFIDVDVEIASSHLIVPQEGTFKGKEPCVVVNLGAINIKSQPRSEKALDVSNMFREGLCDEEIFKQVMEHTYDKFEIKLKDVQLVVANVNDDWREALSKTNEATTLHLLQPTTLTIVIHKCMLTNEPRLPKIKINGQLQKLVVNAYESRLLTLLSILVSIPLPQSDKPPPPLKRTESKGSNLSLRKYLETAEIKRKEKSKFIADEETAQLTEVEALFILNELVLQIASSDDAILAFSLKNLELKATKKSFTLEALVRLGSVGLTHIMPETETIQLISTPEVMASEGETVNPYLLSISYTDVDKNSPDFRSIHKSVEKLIVLDFTTLKVLFHLEALKRILFVANEYQRKIQEVQGEKDRVVSAGSPLETINEDDELTIRQSKASTVAKEKSGKKKQVETIQLKVKVTIGAVDIQFSTERRVLADAFVHGMDLALLVKESYTQADVTVGDMRILDRNPASEYKEILGVVSGNVLNIRIVMYNIEKYPHISHSNMSIEAQINCLKIVFLNWFVSSMLDFLNNFQAAQEAIIEASKQTADVAKANVQSAYKNLTKIALNIKLSAPIIVVPENSTSLNVVWLDLGEMHLKNEFFDKTVEGTNTKVTLDELTLSLQNIKIACVRLIPNSDEFKEESVMLKPTNFTLLVKRNLSVWFTSLPRMEISGKLNTIEISANDSDFKRVMSILEGNLQEGKLEVTQSAQTHKHHSHKQRTTDKPTVEQKISAVSISTPEKEVPFTIVKFTFTLDSFVVNLDQSVEDKGTIVESKKLTGLAKLCFNLLCLRGRMLSDDSIHTSVRLLDCTLDDMRPQKTTKITRYFERRPDAMSATLDMMRDGKMDDNARSMIDVTYTMKNSDTFIDIRIFSFNLILAMDFLMRLNEFVQGSPKVTSSTAMEQTQNLQTKKKAVAQESQQAKPISMLTVNVKVEKPDIILVESFDDEDCEALILNTEVIFKMRVREERTVMDGSITTLQLYRRSEGSTKAFVLEPCNLSLAVAKPDNKGMNVDLSISDIKLNISPDTIGLLNRVFATLLKKDQDEEMEGIETITYDNIWAMKPFVPSSYWFMKTEEGVEAFEDSVSSCQSVAENSVAEGNEICIAGCPSVTVALQVGVGNDTLPLLVLNSSISALIKDWSRDLNVKASMTLLISYYNITKALWEPLLEPVELLQDNRYQHVPWELKIDVAMRPKEEMNDASTGDVEAQARLVTEQRAQMELIVSSDHTMEVTFTSTCLNVLTDLQGAYMAAITPTSPPTSSKQATLTPMRAPYIVHNCTGITVKLLLEESSDFRVYTHLDQKSTAQQIKEVVLETDAEAFLQQSGGGIAKIKLNEPPPSFKLKLSLPDYKEVLTIPVEKADKRYFPLMKNKTMDQNQEKTAIISEVLWQEGSIHLYLSSGVKIINELSVPLTIYYMTKGGKEIDSVKKLGPDEIVRLPLQAVHTRYGELYFCVEDYSVSSAPFVWRDLRYEHFLSRLLECNTKTEDSKSKFYLRVIGVTDQILFEGSDSRSLHSQAYTLTVRPAVMLQNCLPVPLTLNLTSGPLKLASGELTQLVHCLPYSDTLTLLLDEYQEKCWSCASRISDRETEISVWSFESHDSPEKFVMELGMHSVDQNGTQMLSLYCPFWMLNKTGLTLSYRAEHDGSNVLFHPANFSEPILFSFRAKNFFGKKKASVRVDFGEWSEKFSLDLAGSSGVVLCKTENKMYTLSVANQLTFNSLTKMVVITPYFLLLNEAPFPLEYQEMHRAADPWMKVEAGCSEPLWPATERMEKLLIMRVPGSEQHTAPFSYTSQHTTTLKLHDYHGGFNVETQISEKGSYITVRQYQPDTAPALILNYTELPITFYEKENVNVRRLEPRHQVLYAWENPAGSRVLMFECSKEREFENDLRRDGYGKFYLSDGSEAYWASFLEGHQRIIFLTSSSELAECALTRGKAGKILTEFKISLLAVGLSLVDDANALEILYLSVSSSGIIWESCKINGRRYKKITEPKSTYLEEAFQKYTNQVIVTKGAVPSVVQIDTKTQIDFRQLLQLKPSPKILRRTLEAGVLLWFGIYENSRRLHVKLHKIQIDQHVPGSAFPVLLAAVPPPKSVAAQLEPKPFVEISIIERVMPHTTVKQYTYFRVLVQEFHVKVDMTFINAVVQMFPQKTITEEEALELFTQDLVTARKSLFELTALGVANEQKNFYDNLHLSPIKVHISFSLGGATQLPTFIGTILQGIGVTLTDMNDVVLKLGYYEREFEFLSQRELISQVQAHYTSQALRQLYVLVLGLDVLGNPYGLVLGLKKGVEDLFYEPFQGLIQGPSEFAEGLALGVRSLAGHVVGGAAGAVARITGAVGTGLAALSLDKDYQAARRTTRATRPATLQEGLARSGRGLVMGVVDGVTGVFTKPVSGAKSGGVEGFFKGLGQGAAGLVARPTAGVVDFASGSFDAVKRAAELSDEVQQLRDTRLLNKDAGVKPYSKSKAAGNKLLKELEKGKYAETDKYICHVLCAGEKEGMVCTDKRIIYFQKCNVFGQIQVEWTYLWSELPDAPMQVDKGIFIPIPHKKVFGVFSNSNNGKIINVIDDAKRKYVFTKCQEAFAASRR